MKFTALVILLTCLLFASSCTNTPATASSPPALVQQDISFSFKSELRTDVSLAIADLRYSWERRSPYSVQHGMDSSQEKAPLYDRTIQATDVHNAVIGIIIEEVDSNGEEVAMIRFTVAESNAMREGHDVLLLLTETGIEIEFDGSSRKINWIIPPADWKSASVPQTSP